MAAGGGTGDALVAEAGRGTWGDGALSIFVGLWERLLVREFKAVDFFTWMWVPWVSAAWAVAPLGAVGMVDDAPAFKSRE